MSKALRINFLLGTSLVSLFPFLILFFFTVPCSDDIYYHNSTRNSPLLDFLIAHYNTWTGRYFSNLLMAINPFSMTSEPRTYPWMLIGLFFLFFVSLFFLLKALLRILNIPTAGHRMPFFLTVLFLALFFHKMPRTTDTFYWFAGASAHLLPLSFAFISVSLYFNFCQTKYAWLAALIMAILSFAISGSNETLAVQWIYTLFFGIFYQKVIHRRWDAHLCLALLVALAGFIILYLSPGNKIRANELKGGHDILLLLIKPWGLIIETTVRYLSFSLVFVILWTFPFLKKINQSLPEHLKKTKSVQLLLLFGLGLYALTFVPSVWTMGGLPPRRVLNNTYMMFLLYGTFVLILCAHKLPFIERWGQSLDLAVPVKFQKIIFSIGLIFVFNNFYAWKDLINTPKFIESMEKRELVVKAGHGSDLVIEPLSYFPTTYFYEDITTKPDDYRNLVFSQFYGLKSVLLSHEYQDKDSR